MPVSSTEVISDLNFSLVTADATIEGILVDEAGNPVTGAEGWAGATHIVSPTLHNGAPIQAGAFVIHVPRGIYRVAPQSNYVGLLHHKNVPVASDQTVTVPLSVTARDGLITGTVLGPDGAPLTGAQVIADGIGPLLDKLWLSTRSGEDGRFRLRVPHGDYHLGATIGVTDSIKPALRRVSVPAGGVSGGHVLQFRRPDAVISGAVSISDTTGMTGTVLIWGWSEDDAFVKTRVPLTNSAGVYSLDVISNTTWRLGAVYETASQYWATREKVILEAGGATQALVLTGPHPKPAPVAVTFDAARPQRILLADGTHIYIPAGAMPVAGQVTLHIVPIATLPHQRHANVYRYGYAFTAVDGEGQPVTEHFNHDVIIGFAYDDGELWRQGIAERFLIKKQTLSVRMPQQPAAAPPGRR